MQIQWFYRDQPLAPTLFFDKSDAVYHQLNHVLRAQIGDTIICFDGQNAFYYRITTLDKKSLQAERGEPKENTNKPLPITLAIALPHHKDKLELVVQKAVELGISEIICVQTDFAWSTKYWNDKYYDRLRSIMIEACEQSERITLPTLHREILPLTHFVHKPNVYACVERTQTPITSLFPLSQAQSTILIGPEGGWSPREQEQLIQSNQAFTLGETILRLETAALYALSIFRYESSKLV